MWKPIVALVAGYLVALPVMSWALHDLRRFHHYDWSGYGRPAPWRNAFVVSYALAGWPAFVVAFMWRTRFARRAMIEQRSDRHRNAEGA